ncbi:carboxypeptidase regulatory-like domain-containing protein [Phytomonospora endophytica]|uniref:Carboxypeptidase regulatory-like domain-containing protein n=1 Tax=Phytomonospora endophytica TaxID=714109 RepID=A0A841FI35_9ACTN|nr:carboxypeptidase regulatory-like domain-containing protein [Phytomonospora endophytica]MBB6035524.1 hypothetical protein [Phytomonospora endophytica]
MATKRMTLRWLRGAAASALAALTLVVLAQSPAHADGEVSITFNPGSVRVDIGGGVAPATMTLQATGAISALDVTVTGGVQGLNNQAGVDMGGGSGCQGGGNTMQCRIEPGGTAVIQLSVAPRPESNLPQGESINGSYDVTASARDGQGGGGNSGGSLPIQVVGAANPDSVPSITGTISGDGNKPLEGVKVEATDAEKATFEATTGSDGVYNIVPNGGGTIAPGEITLKATKAGYDTKTVKVNGIGGEPAQSKFTMVKKTAKPDDSGSAAPPPADNGTAAEDKDDGWGLGTWILAIVGVLFVVGGIVAIVLLLKRGKHDEEDDDLFADKPPVHTPKAAQTGLPGVYDAGPRSPVMDAPTMIHNGPLLDDEDLARYGSGGPSAAPPTTAFGPAYGDRGEQPTQMFDPRAAGPVSGAPMSGGPVSGGPVSGAPTQMFDPRGYDDRDSYGSPPPAPSRGGYDERDRGYGPPSDRDRGYGPPSQDQRGGYGDQGYGAPAPDPRGYDDRDRGYGPPAAPPPPPPMPPAAPPAPSHGGYGDRDRGYGPPSQDQRGGYGDQGYGAPAAPEPRGYDDRYAPPAQDPRGYGPPPQQSYEQDPRYDRPQQGGGYGPPPQDQRGGYDERDRDRGYGPPPPPAPPESRDGYDDRGYDDRPRW